MASVQVEALTKRFGEVEALKGLTFEIADGSFFCLLGPPGAGKTTTLRIIAGLEKPDAGRVLIGGEPVNGVAAQDRDVAMVFEDLALYPHWTGFGNLAHPLRLRKLPREDIDRRVRQIAERLHISHLLDRRPETYSGGERRRLAIGRALVRRPRVLLLDEPLTDLDAKIRQEMTAELKRLQRDTGQTMIYATHDFEEAMGMADTIMVINQGETEQVGSPEELYEHPHTSFVAGFIGSPAMNLVACKFVEQNGEVLLDHPGFRIPAPRAHLKDHPSSVTLGIRPEHVQVVEGEAADAFPSRVEIVQVLGDEMILDVGLRDGTVIKIVSPVSSELVSGAECATRFPPERIFLFDPATGQRLLGPGV
jgi:multiple sugar transport system ATP-binding protein